MRHALKLHPDSHSTAATRIDVQVNRPRPGDLAVDYFVSGKIDHLHLPQAGAPSRGDALWQHTCFEAFVATSPGDAYYEFNFSPSLQWAAYHFSGYRKDMSIVSDIETPQVKVKAGDESFHLQARLDLDRLPGLLRSASWRLGISAILEETGGDKSYWALAHPPGKADFHHADCFARSLDAGSVNGEPS